MRSANGRRPSTNRRAAEDGQTGGPKAASVASRIPCDGTDEGAFLIPSKGASFVAPFKQFPSPFRPFTLRPARSAPAGEVAADHESRHAPLQAIRPTRNWRTGPGATPGGHAVGNADTDFAGTGSVLSLQTGHLQPDDMEDTKTGNGRGRPEGDASELGEVRVFSKPGPDAEDRLRRLFSLLVKYATQDGQATSEKDSASDDQPAEDHLEAEA